MPLQNFIDFLESNPVTASWLNSIDRLFVLVFDEAQTKADARTALEVTSTADLASTANGDGASLIGIEDAAGNFTAATVEGALAETLSDLASTTDTALGDALVGFKQDLTGSTARTVHAKLSEIVSVKDFGAVGDGVTDDAAALQVAIDAGDSIFFPAGIYVIGGTASVTIESNKTLYGEGDRSIIRGSAAGRTSSNDFLKNADQASGNSNIVLRDLRIEGDRANAADQINGIDLDGGVSNAVIDNVTFVDHGVGVWLGNVDGVQVQNCRFLKTSANKSGVALSATSGSSKRVSITGNYFGPSDEEAVDVNAAAQHVVIAGNIFYQNHANNDVGDVGEAIDVGSSGQDITDVVITGNLIDLDTLNTSARAGIYVKQGTERVVISGNLIRNGDNTSPGGAITIANSSRIAISGNVIESCRRGVVVSDAGGLTSETQGLSIIGNQFRSVFQEGIELKATSILAVAIVANVIDGLASNTNTDGIHANNVTGLHIANNEIFDFDDDGIAIESSCANVAIEHNTVRDCGGDGISNAAANASIVGNILKDNTTIGIRQSGARGRLLGNSCNGNGLYGIALAAGADRCVVKGNNLFSNTGSGLSLGASLDDLVIDGNIGDSNTISDFNGITNADGNSVVHHNVGYVTEKTGSASISPDANGNGTIAHGLVGTPTAVIVGIRGDNANGVDVESVDGTNITVRIKDASGADVTAGAFTVDWSARFTP